MYSLSLELYCTVKPRGDIVLRNYSEINKITIIAFHLDQHKFEAYKVFHLDPLI
jgi:hypothetical protein